MDVRTAWLEPPTQSGGLDHLGIQQTPIRIFSTLLPGLTVVTDRVGCYTFYSWLVWAYLKDKAWLGVDFVTALRRAECLFTLIAEHHASTEAEHVALHSRGLVGRFSLTPALADDVRRPIPLADLAALRSDNKGSYFKNRYGGLGQYYLGPMRELGILDRHGDEVVCSEDVGVPLAKAFEARVDRCDFFRVIRRGTVSERELEELSSFCPCGLAGHVSEREALIDVLFARKGRLPESDRLRRETFLLLLDLAAQRGPAAADELDLAFKAACLTEALDDSKPWRIPSAWEQTRRAWAVYERSDELSVAVLGVFWVVLRLLDEQGGAAASSAAASKHVRDLVRKTLPKLARQAAREAIRGNLSTLPPLASWCAPDHEFQRAIGVWEAARRDDMPACLEASLGVLLALGARHTSSQPYLDVAIPPDYLSYYPLNLSSFRQMIEGDWGELTVADWLADIAASWGIEAHLRVALRKLHGESIVTFLVYATDDGIRRREGRDPPKPGFTASRVDRAVRFLVDLGLAHWDMREGAEQRGEDSEDALRGWVARITPLGRELLEALRG